MLQKRPMKTGIRHTCRSIVRCLLCLACLVVLCGCQPDNLSTAKRELRRQLSVSFRYSYEESLGKDGITYHFADENGLPFSFTSRQKGFAMDGQIFFSYKDNTCDYPEAFFAFHLPEMEAQWKTLGLDCTAVTEPYATSLQVTLAAYEHVAPAAELVHALLKQFPLPLKADASLFSIPDIQIRNGESYNCSFSFASEGTPIPSLEEIQRALLSGYVTDCKNGLVPNDLPETLRITIPPAHIDSVRFLVEDRILSYAPVSFSYEESVKQYLLPLYDLRDSNTAYFTGGAMKDILGLLGYGCWYRDGFLHYEINGTPYDFALSDNHAEMILYRDSLEVGRFQVTFEDDTSHSVMVAVPADMLAMMLDLSVTVDTQLAEILFHDD